MPQMYRHMIFATILRGSPLAMRHAVAAAMACARRCCTVGINMGRSHSSTAKAEAKAVAWAHSSTAKVPLVTASAVAWALAIGLFTTFGAMIAT